MKRLKRAVCLCLACLLLLGALPLQAYGVPDFSGVEGTTLVKRDGVWYYVKDGAVCYDTTLIKFNGSWYYVENGKVNFSKTTLVKYNGTWYYVTGGKLIRTTGWCSYGNQKYYVSNTAQFTRFR